MDTGVSLAVAGQSNPLRRMTVINIAERKDGAALMFQGSTRMYNLPRSNKKYKAWLALLRQSLIYKKPVKVQFLTERSDTIALVQK
jgi:hypothetical protein